MLKSVVSDSGELFRNIEDCEKEVQKDVDMADKEGLLLHNISSNKTDRAD